LQDTNKIQENRISYLPKYVDWFANIQFKKQREIKNHYLLKTDGYYFKYGIKQENYSFLNTLECILNTPIEEIKNIIIDFLKKDTDQLYYYSLNDGDIRAEYQINDFINFINENQWNQYRNSDSTIDIDEHISFINDANRCCNDISLEEILTNGSPRYDLSQISAIVSIDLKYVNNRIIYKYIPDYDNLYCNYFNKLVLNKNLQVIVNQNLANIPENTVGVHIRQGDFHHMNHIPIYRYYNSYKTQEYFDKLVADYVNEGKYVYICTDTKSYLDKYIKLYGDKIKYYQKSFVDSILNQEKNGQIDAIIELWIMRNLKEINTDDLSSFGFHCKINLDNTLKSNNLIHTGSFDTFEINQNNEINEINENIANEYILNYDTLNKLLLNNNCLIIKPIHGLGNRLRTIGSAYSLCKNNNRILIVNWIPDDHCNCLFTDLYKTNVYIYIKIRY
jgi:hypothetical protein